MKNIKALHWISSYLGLRADGELQRQDYLLLSKKHSETVQKLFGSIQNDLSVDGIHLLPESMKYKMWESYDDQTTDLIGVQCSIDNHGYGRGTDGRAQPYQIAQDNTVVVKDADGYMLTVVTEMYHGSDGAYSCETTTAIPSGTKGRFCLIFYVDKGTTDVTLSIDNHNGTVYEVPITLEKSDEA